MSPSITYNQLLVAKTALLDAAAIPGDIKESIRVIIECLRGRDDDAWKYASLSESEEAFTDLTLKALILIYGSSNTIPEEVDTKTGKSPYPAMPLNGNYEEKRKELKTAELNTQEAYGSYRDDIVLKRITREEFISRLTQFSYKEPAQEGAMLWWGIEKYLRVISKTDPETDLGLIAYISLSDAMIVTLTSFLRGGFSDCYEAAIQDLKYKATMTDRSLCKVISGYEKATEEGRNR